MTLMIRVDNVNTRPIGHWRAAFVAWHRTRGNSGTPMNIFWVSSLSQTYARSCLRLERGATMQNKGYASLCCSYSLYVASIWRSFPSQEVPTPSQSAIFAFQVPHRCAVQLLFVSYRSYGAARIILTLSAETVVPSTTSEG